MFDVIVCGAGPAGSVAAMVLAREGARVLMLDRARFPRHKLCGDTLNPGTLAALRRLRLAEDIEPRGLRIDGMIVTGRRGARVEGAYAPGIYGIALPRRELDDVLLRASLAAGVRFEERVLVRAAIVDESQRPARVRGLVIAGRDGRDLRVPAPIVIAADGRHSRIAFGLGLARHPRRPRRWAIGAYFSDVAGMTAFGEMHVRTGRYIGVAPLPGGLANACLVAPATRDMSSPAALLREALAREPLLRDRFADARLAAPPVVLGPLAVDTSAAGMPGLLLAGDAAGFIDPMTGDGLRFAIRGGELAAFVALRAAARWWPDAASALDTMRRREFAAKWRFNRALRHLVSLAPAVSVASAAAAAAPWTVRRTIAFAGDVARE